MNEPTRQRAAMWREYVGLLVVLGLLILLFGALSRNFLTAKTALSVANQIPDLTVVAIGMTFVLIVAGIDLSVGSVLGLCSVVLGLGLTRLGWPLAGSMLLTVLVGLLCGCVNGGVVVIARIPSFIVTLGMLEIARGLAAWLSGSRTLFIGAQIELPARPLPVAGVSLAFVLAVCAVIAGQFVLSRTVFGRYMVAIGTNERAVQLSGIRTWPVKLAVFALSGTLSAVGAVFYTSRLEAAYADAAVGLELSAIAAVVIGGTSLMGGRGSVVCSFLGVMIIAVLQTGLAQVGCADSVKRIITGAVIIAAVTADTLRHDVDWRSWWRRPAQSDGSNAG